MPASAELLPGQFHTLPDGGRMRYALFDPPETAIRPPRATLLVAPGRREFIEKKYSELGAEFLQCNFRLIIFEWRGQGLSSRFLGGARRQRDHIADFSVHLDDLGSFYEGVVRTHQAGPLLVSGHSMGSHLLLRWMAERQKTGIHAALLTAPMLAIGPRAVQVGASVIAATAVKFGKGEDYAPGQENFGPRERQFDGNPLSQNPGRYEIIARYFDAYPDLIVGGVTWGWLSSALRSMRRMRMPGYLEQVTPPVLAMTGARDRVTPPHELVRYLPRLPRLTNFIVSGARHDLLNEVEDCRAEAWRNIDGFLKNVI